MPQKNDGTQRDNAIKNRFTKYLQVSLSRQRAIYMKQIAEQKLREILVDEPADYECLSPLFHGDSCINQIENQVLSELPLLLGLENETLIKALKKLGSGNLEIFRLRVLEEKPFKEIASTMKLSCDSVKMRYSRIIRQLRNEMVDKSERKGHDNE